MGRRRGNQKLNGSGGNDFQTSLVGPALSSWRWSPRGPQTPPAGLWGIISRSAVAHDTGETCKYAGQAHMPDVHRRHNAGATPSSPPTHAARYAAAAGHAHARSAPVQNGSGQQLTSMVDVRAAYSPATAFLTCRQRDGRERGQRRCDGDRGPSTSGRGHRRACTGTSRHGGSFHANATGGTTAARSRSTRGRPDIDHVLNCTGRAVILRRQRRRQALATSRWALRTARSRRRAPGRLRRRGLHRLARTSRSTADQRERKRGDSERKHLVEGDTVRPATGTRAATRAATARSRRLRLEEAGTARRRPAPASGT